MNQHGGVDIPDIAAFSVVFSFAAAAAAAADDGIITTGATAVAGIVDAADGYASTMWYH